ncbi:MAG: hypothetical protein U9Q37_00335 [Euryarchaeota archaeon]|nr:hypothetical protein [Euryarchaeota archaeon]
MSPPEASNENKEENRLVQTEPIATQKVAQPQWVDTIIERYPEQVGMLLETLPTVIAGNPQKIEADTKIAVNTLRGFFILMSIIVILTAFLAYKGVLSGDAVGFILGSAFGSMITFLYRYLIPDETQ